jgi:hypothetical protein
LPAAPDAEREDGEVRAEPGGLRLSEKPLWSDSEDQWGQFAKYAYSRLGGRL